MLVLSVTLDAHYYMNGRKIQKLKCSNFLKKVTGLMNVIFKPSKV